MILDITDMVLVEYKIKSFPSSAYPVELTVEFFMDSSRMTIESNKMYIDNRLALDGENGYVLKFTRFGSPESGVTPATRWILDAAAAGDKFSTLRIVALVHSDAELEIFNQVAMRIMTPVDQTIDSAAALWNELLEDVDMGGL